MVPIVNETVKLLTRTLLLTLWAFVLMSPGGAKAEVEIRESTEYYDFEANSFRELVLQMQRKGPKDDKGEHAIAVTITRIKPTYSVKRNGSECYIASVKTIIDVTIRYPNWVNDYQAPRQVQYAWEKFMAEVVDHEDQHSAYSSDVAYALDNDLEFLDEHLPCRELKNKAEEIIRYHFNELDRLNEEFHMEEDRKWIEQQNRQARKWWSNRKRRR
jgi:predicted secreted Zn-dependent protease